MGEYAWRNLPFNLSTRLIMKFSLSLLPLSLILLFTPITFAVERLYYVAADEVIWDYAPIRKNLMMGMTLSEEQNVFVKNSPNTTGSRYKKAQFRQYTDASFTTLKPRSNREEHLGLLGPLFRAEVGDTIKVVFKNNASRAYSIHPHGVFYSKANEGAPTNDGTGTMPYLPGTAIPISGRCAIAQARDHLILAQLSGPTTPMSAVLKIPTAA